MLLICDWIAAFFHEIGHAIAGWAVEMRPVQIAVGPIVARERGGCWKTSFSLASMLTAGGSAATVPIHLRDLRRRMAFEIAGGPAASLLTALGFHAFLPTAPGSAWQV